MLLEDGGKGNGMLRLTPQMSVHVTLVFIDNARRMNAGQILCIG